MPQRRRRAKVTIKKALSVASAAHAAYDLRTHATCPTCNHRVVLYVCINCRRPVKPRRRKRS